MSLANPPPRFHLRDLGRGVEPPPLAIITRQPWHPYAIIAVACIGSLLGANSMAVLVKSIDPAQRARAMGVFAAAQAIGISTGPLLGGLLLLAVFAAFAAILSTVRRHAGAEI
jgi:MFS family permease